MEQEGITQKCTSCCKDVYNNYACCTSDPEASGERCCHVEGVKEFCVSMFSNSLDFSNHEGLEKVGKILLWSTATIFLIFGLGLVFAPKIVTFYYMSEYDYRESLGLVTEDEELHGTKLHNKRDKATNVDSDNGKSAIIEALYSVFASPTTSDAEKKKIQREATIAAKKLSSANLERSIISLVNILFGSGCLFIGTMAIGQLLEMRDKLISSTYASVFAWWLFFSMMGLFLTLIKREDSIHPTNLMVFYFVSNIVLFLCWLRYKDKLTHHKSSDIQRIAMPKQPNGQGNLHNVPLPQ